MTTKRRTKRNTSTIKGKDTSKRAKPLVAGAGYMGGRKPYKCGGKASK